MRSDNGVGKELSRTGRARREDIIAAAIAVIGRDGYAVASIERIAQQAQTSKGTVLYHFGTKAAVCDAVVASLFEEGGAHMTEQIAAVQGHRAKLRAYLTANLEFIAGRPAHVNAVHHIVENGAGQTGRYDAVGPLRQLLTAGQAAGEFGDFDAELMALAIRAIVDGASFYFTSHSGVDVAHFVNETVQLFDKATAPQRRRKGTS